MLSNANIYKYIGYIAIISSIYLIVSYSFNDKRNAYERSRKQVQANENRKEKNNEESIESEDESSFFERFINIFSDDSEEEVE